MRVQSDPAGRLVITGQPEQLDNPWGITAFKKVHFPILLMLTLTEAFSDPRSISIMLLRHMLHVLELMVF